MWNQALKRSICMVDSLCNCEKAVSQLMQESISAEIEKETIKDIDIKKK